MSLQYEKFLSPLFFKLWSGVWGEWEELEAVVCKNILSSCVHSFCSPKRTLVLHSTEKWRNFPLSFYNRFLSTGQIPQTSAHAIRLSYAIPSSFIDPPSLFIQFVNEQRSY